METIGVGRQDGKVVLRLEVFETKVEYKMTSEEAEVIADFLLQEARLIRREKETKSE